MMMTIGNPKNQLEIHLPWILIEGIVHKELKLNFQVCQFKQLA
jgi:hypothetical protein